MKPKRLEYILDGATSEHRWLWVDYWDLTPEEEELTLAAVFAEQGYDGNEWVDTNLYQVIHDTGIFEFSYYRNGEKCIFISRGKEYCSIEQMIADIMG